MMTFLALVLSQIIYQATPPPVILQPVVPEQPQPVEPPENFHPEFSDAQRLEQDMGDVDRIRRDTRSAELSRGQRLRLYDSVLKKLGDIDAALAAGEGRHEDELGEVRASIGAIRSARPGSVSETSNLAIGFTAVANAEVAERSLREHQTRAEISRAQRVLFEAREEAQSSAAR